MGRDNPLRWGPSLWQQSRPGPHDTRLKGEARINPLLDTGVCELAPQYATIGSCDLSSSALCRNPSMDLSSGGTGGRPRFFKG